MPYPRLSHPLRFPTLRIRGDELTIFSLAGPMGAWKHLFGKVILNRYKVLQVDPQAEREVIEAAYKRLASKYHPDVNNSESANERMTQLNAAYEILRDPDRRQQYDDQRRARRRVRNTETAPPSQQPTPDKIAKQVSNRVFVKLLWVVALVALVIYFPWGIAVLLCLGGAIGFVRKFPVVAMRIGKTALALLVAFGLFWWRQERQAQTAREDVVKVEQKARDAARNTDIQLVLNDALEEFTKTCIAGASSVSPDRAKAYCECSAKETQLRFDLTPIHVDSVSEYQQAFRLKFKAASEDPSIQSTCLAKTREAPSPNTSKRNREATPDNLPRIEQKVLRAIRTGDNLPVLNEALVALKKDCIAKATTASPDRAKAYCACVAKETQSRFDLTPIRVNSVREYKLAFDSRFTAAERDPSIQAACLVKPRAAPSPQASERTREATPDDRQRAIYELLQGKQP